MISAHKDLIVDDEGTVLIRVMSVCRAMGYALGGTTETRWRRDDESRLTGTPPALYMPVDRALVRLNRANSPVAPRVVAAVEAAAKVISDVNKKASTRPEA